MLVMTLGWIGLCASMIFTLIYLVPRGYRALHTISDIAPIIKMSLTIVLIALGSIILWTNSANIWINTWGPILAYSAGLFSYLVHLELFNTDIKPRSYRAIVLLVVLLTGIEVWLNIERGTNIGSFIANEPYQPTLSYFWYWFITFSMCLFLSTLILRLFNRELEHTRELNYKVRVYFGFLGFTVCTIGLVSTIIGLLVSYMIGDTYCIILFCVAHIRYLFNAIFLLCMFLMGMLWTFYILPQSVYSILMNTSYIHPFIRAVERRNIYHHDLKRYLRNYLLKVTQNIQHRPESLSDKRINIELGDARYRVWSNNPRNQPITGKAEAKLIMQLVLSGVIYTRDGSAMPPPLSTHIDHHNITTAKYLQRLEKRLLSVRSGMKNSIPILNGHSIIGNLLDYRHDRLSLLMRMAQSCGDIGQTRIGTRNVVLVNAPEYIHQIFVERACEYITNPIFRIALKPLLGNGLFTGIPEHHRSQRTFFVPAFQHRRIATYADTMAAYAEQFQERWSDGDIVDLNREMAELVLQITGKTLFNIDVLDSSSELRRAMTQTSYYTNALFNALIIVPLSWPLPQNMRFRRTIAQFNCLVEHMIHERRSSNHDRDDILSMLITAQAEDGQRMSDEQIRAEVLTLLLAGYETTTNALIWACCVLAHHPPIYARLQLEVDTVLQGRTPTAADLTNLPYTLQIVKEVLRLYPPVYLIAREPIQDTYLDTYRLHSRDLILISPYTLHRRSTYFPDPSTFNPDRFAPEHAQDIPRHAYIPFGAGPHTCIGNHFAMTELHIVLATLAQRVSFELSPGQKLTPEPLITLRPHNDIKMCVRRRSLVRTVS